MNVNKQLLNLGGIVLVVAIIVAGLALFALPMYTQSQQTDSQTNTVAQTNGVYEAQIAQLSAANDRIDEIDANLADLRSELPAAGQLDDVFEIITKAADAEELTIESIVAADAEPWTARATLDESGTPVAEAAPATAETTDAAATDGTAEAATTDTATTPAGPAAEDTTRQQVAVTIAAQVEDPATAAAFIDRLDDGARLLLPIDVNVGDGTLTATVLAFIRTEG